MEVKVRFAPSPTGHVHIGNIRTAIFNWLFARHNKGKFLLRIEDTDLERSTKEAIDALLDCMSWLKLDYDGKIMYQSQRSDIHLNAAQKLIDNGLAYKQIDQASGEGPTLFRIPLDSSSIPNVRTIGSVSMDVHPDFPVNINYTGVTYAQVSKKGKPMESASCLAGLKELEVFDTEGKLIFQLNNELDSIVTEKTEFTLENCKEFRFTRQEVFYQDQIKGELAKPLDSMKDLVIIRSDGSPVFHLANVCDDVEQEVTHIIRGDDHVENTYRHIFLFHALGYKIPKYGHMPMIVNQSGKPYSKRDGDAFVGDFRDKGYLSDALFNYLSLLGWAPGDDREKLSRQELIEAFSLERVKSSPAQLDFNKLLNMNGLYIAEMQTADFAAYAWNFRNDFDWLRGVEFDNFAKIAGFMQSRTRLISQLEDWKYFFSDDLNYNHKLARKALKKEEIKSGLEVLAEKLAELKDFTLDNFESAIRGVEADFDLEQGKLNQPLRIAVTGSGAGADIFETLKLIGPQKIAARIEASLAMDFSGETV